MSPGDARASFDALFAGNDDPWGFKTRWYEQRKRELTLACLPAARYASAYEPGCANGELAAALAPRCARLRVSDGSEAAVALARRRLAALPHVTVAQEWLPGAWPQQRFDLIVLSEFCFYLDADALTDVAQRARASLTDGGTLLACHWRRANVGFPLDGDAVHTILRERLSLPRLLRHEEPDFTLEVWSGDPRSVAQRDGMVD